MNEHPAPAPPPRRIVVHRTATDILKQTTSIFSTRNNLLMFLLLSFVLLYQRLSTDLAVHALTSYIDNEPSIKSIIYRNHGPPNSTSPTTRSRHRRHPFLQVTRVGILDDEFSSEDDELEDRFFGSVPKPQLNASSFILDSSNPQFGYSNFVSDNGIRASETVRSSTKINLRSSEIIEKEENVVIDQINDSAPFNETAESKTEFTALLFPIGVFSAAYGFLMLVFVFIHSLVHGIIFVSVLNDFCRKRNSFVSTYSYGFSLGLRRSSIIILLKWLVRAAFSNLFGLWYFGGFEDQYSFVKIVVRLNFMPYSIMVPWVEGFEKERQDFIFAWNLADYLASFVLALDPWIVMALNSRKTASEVVKEGWDLLSLMIHPAMTLKGYEGIVCGLFARGALAAAFGDLFAISLQSFMEVYFMVAWMVYYLSVKSIDAESRGQPFGQREVEAMLLHVR